MIEGEKLKMEIRAKFKNMKDAYSLIGISNTTLYEWFKLEKLATDDYELIVRTTGIDIRNKERDVPPKNSITEQKLYDLQEDYIILLKKYTALLEKRQLEK